MVFHLNNSKKRYRISGDSDIKKIPEIRMMEKDSEIQTETEGSVVHYFMSGIPIGFVDKGEGKDYDEDIFRLEGKNDFYRGPCE